MGPGRDRGGSIGNIAAAAGTMPAMLIRRSTAADADAVRQIHAEAFRRADGAVAPEVGLLDELIAAGGVIAPLSLVAVRDSRPVGHGVAVEGRPVVAVGPLGVLPGHQRSGVGLALMHAVLAAADAL
jgi:putative acetyltransferase